jgi:6-pyruvoyltetrahydropterin/6-carboxytetrahydropterin synthase
MGMSYMHTGEFTATHISTLLPRWHPCGLMHQHDWAITLVLATDDGTFSDQEQTTHRVVLAEFDSWVEQNLNRRHLNNVDAALTDHGCLTDVGRWVYTQWHERLPRLREVVVQGPKDSTRETDEFGFPVRQWTKYTYRPEICAA